MQGRYVVRITPADVGSRVSIRSRTHSQPPATDTVGLLVGWEGGVVTVERRDGTKVQLHEADLLAGKTIPAPPSRNR